MRRGIQCKLQAGHVDKVFVDVQRPHEHDIRMFFLRCKVISEHWRNFENEKKELQNQETIWQSLQKNAVTDAFDSERTCDETPARRYKPTTNLELQWL